MRLNPPLFRRGTGSVVVVLLEFGVDAARFGELVFEDDDPARGLEWGAGGDEFVCAGGDAQLIARVAAVPTRGALWGEQFRGIEAAQESLPYAEEFGGVAHAVGGIVFVVELAGQVAGGLLCRDGGLLSLEWTGPPARGAPGAETGRSHSLNQQLHSSSFRTHTPCPVARLKGGAGT
ncbi:hypothetical protein B0E55_06300 [Rhodococcus sp. 66b]|nr:hypothetical protein B0E55_06300 [Rhodococcus sp. 66b]